MKLGNPQLLWMAAALLPLLAFFLWRAWRQKQRLMAQFVHSRLLEYLTANVSRTRQKVRLWLAFAAVACTLLALARPQWGFAWEEATQRGLDVVVAIDTSRSMLAEDISPNRLARAKLASLDLMRLARSDRLGLIAFAGTAFLQCPLTLDEEAFRQSVNALDVGIIPQGGSSLAAAIQTAQSAFAGEAQNHRVLILFSDGEDHEEGAVAAAREAAKAGLRIFTIGIGTPQGELLRQTEKGGAQAYIKDAEGNVVKSRLNENLLREIATVAEGFYLPLRGAGTMDTLYERGLAPLPKGELSAKLVKRFHERFQWPLALALLLLIIEMFLPEIRKRAARPAAMVEAPAAKAMAAVALILLLPATALASPSGALRKFEKGDYTAAQQEYQRLLERTPDDPRLHYNAGSAAYRAQQFEEAARSFEAALRSTDLQLQQLAYYNLGNALFRQGEPLPDPKQKLEAWENAAANYERALKLKTDDADAQHNLELVRKKLEELKEQMQQQSQPDQSDESEQSDPSDPSESKSEQKPEPSPDQQQPQQKPDEQNQQQQENQPPAADDPSQRERDEAQKPQPDAESKPKPDEQPEPGQTAPAAMGQMTLEEAKKLLDAQRDEVKALIFQPQDKKPTAPSRVFKDW
jgi:Ca-activated chloride channel homolog